MAAHDFDGKGGQVMTAGQGGIVGGHFRTENPKSGFWAM